MTYLPATHFETAGDYRPEPRLRRAFGAVVEFLELFGAAARVSRAVDSRRQPAQADLQTLGINGKLPMPW